MVMWYNYLNRDQPYLRSYRTHNLWLDQYHKMMRTQRIQGFHIGLFKRMAKTYSGARVMATLWGFTFIGMIKFFISFKDPVAEDKVPSEMYNRLLTIYSKNKLGYHTRIMADFDLLLEAALNERFIDESTAYYDDPVSLSEIEDIELGLNSDLSQGDVAHLMSEGDSHHAARKTCSKLPGRFGTNYDKTDDLSVYKVLPRGTKAVN